MTSSRAYFMGAVLYPAEDDSHKKALDFLSKDVVELYWINHTLDLDEDGNLKKPHVHAVWRFENARSLSGVARWLKIEPNYIQRVQNFKGALRYLVHMDDKDKHQYSVTDVHCRDLNKYVDLINFDKSKSDLEKMKELLDYINSRDSLDKLSARSLFAYAYSVGLGDAFRKNFHIIMAFANERWQDIMKERGVINAR